jgi:hypothetical protein
MVLWHIMTPDGDQNSVHRGPDRLESQFKGGAPGGLNSL